MFLRLPWGHNLEPPFPWRFPKSWRLVVRENPNLKWMMTGGNPICVYVYIYIHVYMYISRFHYNRCLFHYI